MNLRIVFFLFVCLTCRFTLAQEEKKEFSGPQVGEAIPKCEVKVFVGPESGKTIDVTSKAEKKPQLLIFVHVFNRPAIGLSNAVLKYAATRKKDELQATMIFLSNDPGEMQKKIERAKHALPKNLNVGVSVDGAEGPGAFGLNRKMEVTAIVGKEKKVTGNFALTQPSIPSDVLKIAKSISKTLGDKKQPTLNDLGLNRGRMARPQAKGTRVDDGYFRSLMSPLIQKDATKDEVDAAAAKIVKAAAKDAALKARIHSVANRIIDAGKLENYGTEVAQEYLKKWSKEFEAPRTNNKNNPSEKKVD